MIITEIRTRQDLVELVNEIGFLPFFSGRIEGFSLEENVSYEAWYQGRWSGRVKWDAWDWKGEVLQNKELVYGKFFEKKVGFISKDLWPEFCNYRRDGYDFEYSKRKNGDEYGWGNCRYDIAEKYWGDKLCRSAYKRDPEDSLERVIKHIRKVLPKMDEEDLRALLKA